MKILPITALVSVAVTLTLTTLLGTGLAHADLVTISQLLDRYFEEGGRRYSDANGSELWKDLCSSCHGAGPRDGGHDTTTSHPLPSLKVDGRPNFTLDGDGIDRHLEEICRQRMERPCEAQEKGDLLVHIVVG